MFQQITLMRNKTPSRGVNIIGRKYIFLFISLTLVIISLLFLGLWGLRLGIDFKGGSLLEVEYTKNRPSIDEVKNSLEPYAIGSILVQPTGDRGLILRFKEISEDTHQEILKKLLGGSWQAGENKMVEKRFDTIGPTIGRELQRRSIFALVLAMAAIIVYIAWAFRKVSKPVSSWKYGVVAIVALIHDVTIPTGVFAALGHFRGVEVDALFITALLTILGFSVHDTIVVFDRIRENLHKLKSPEPYVVTVNKSINETLMRSINTSFTVLLVLSAIFFLGGETIHYFSLSLILGVVFGTYSSIFVASPLLVIWQRFGANKIK